MDSDDHGVKMGGSWKEATTGLQARWQEPRWFLFETGFDWRFQYVSADVIGVCGYMPNELLGKSIVEYLADRESRFRFPREMRALVSGDIEEAKLDLNFLHKEGRKVKLRVVGRLGSRATGMEKFYGCASDGESSRIAATRLELLDQVLNTVETIVLVGNGEGQIIYVNPAVRRILGFEPGEVLGYGWWRLMAPDWASAKVLCERYALYGRGEMAARAEVREEHVRDKTGKTRRLLWQDAKGPQDLIISVGQDITEHRNTDEALEQGTRKLRAIFEATLEGMLILNDELRYIEANPAACKILGRTRAEILGKEMGCFSDDPLGTKERIKSVLDQGPDTGTGEFRLSNGAVLDLEYTAKKNILPGVHLVVMKDVSHRKRLEQQLQQSQKMEAIGQLAGGVAHDFNNLLTAIRGYGELLQRVLAPNSEHRRYADNIVNASERATMVTQQLLAFSRRQVVQPREINLNHVVQDMGKLLQKLIGEDIQLRISADANLGTVLADAGQLGQILLNLAVNARDAMPNGGTITIETQNTKIDETYARIHLKVAPGNYVMLTFTDTGCGMSKEVLARIFEPFFTTKAAGKGTGLGLSTVYGIIEQARGAVYVYSEPGEGTSFKLYFPRADSVEEHTLGEDSCGGDGSRVLVIEDDPETGRLLADFLRKHGYRVLSASSGGEALQLCEKEKGKIELVISDITMAGADGLDVQGYFGIEHPEAKMMFISGYTRNILRERGILSPDAIFLQKPFRWEELRVLIEEVTGTHGGRARVQ